MSGCFKARHSLSIYCRNHRKRRDLEGHPTIPLPTYQELTTLENTIKDWLETEYVGVNITRDGFKKIWGSALVKLRQPRSHAIPFFQLEGTSGLTQRSKGSVILAWYDHRNGQPLGAAMLRYMAVMLWASLRFTFPDGKKNFTKERNFFVNTRTGKFVLHHSGFHKVKTERTIIGWQDDLLSFGPGGTLRKTPIVETTTKKQPLRDCKAAPVSRAIGALIKDAVEFALGPQWFAKETLRAKATIALDDLNKKKEK